MSIILGIDPGSTYTGWAVLKAGQLQEHGRIHTHQKHESDHETNNTLPQRLLAIHTHLKTLVEKYNPHVLITEEVFVNAYQRSALILAHARAMIYLISAQHNIPLHAYTATTVKKSVTGYGHASKAQMQEMIRTLLGVKLTPDAADAAALALCHHHFTRY